MYSNYLHALYIFNNKINTTYQGRLGFDFNIVTTIFKQI